MSGGHVIGSQRHPSVLCMIIQVVLLGLRIENFVLLNLHHGKDNTIWVVLFLKLMTG